MTRRDSQEEALTSKMARRRYMMNRGRWWTMMMAWISIRWEGYWRRRWSRRNWIWLSKSRRGWAGCISKSCRNWDRTGTTTEKTVMTRMLILMSNLILKKAQVRVDLRMLNVCSIFWRWNSCMRKSSFWIITITKPGWSQTNYKSSQGETAVAMVKLHHFSMTRFGRK